MTNPVLTALISAQNTHSAMDMLDQAAIQLGRAVVALESAGRYTEAGMVGRRRNELQTLKANIQQRNLRRVS